MIDIIEMNVSTDPTAYMILSFLHHTNNSAILYYIILYMQYTFVGTPTLKNTELEQVATSLFSGNTRVSSVKAYSAVHHCAPTYVYSQENRRYSS